MYSKKQNITGKTKKLLDDNKDFNFKERFGGIPKSIMKFKKSKKLMNLIEYDNSELGKVEGAAKARGGGYAKKLRYSIYNPDQAYFILDYYTRPGDVVLDPFMGRGTRPIITLHLDRKYIGYDTSKKTVELNQGLIERKMNDKVDNAKLIHGDGTSAESYKDFINRDLKVDAVFTCPPYYNIEKYSGEDGDLSQLKHNEFDDRINEMFSNLYKVIKTSSYKDVEFYPVIITVGSLRKGNKGIIDMDRVFQNIAIDNGFVLHDKMFTENLTPGAGFTFRRNYGYRFLTKNHETTLIFMKYKELN
tara:strand:+ start:211 stop:1119 length:909 start_codon:yes stop_codon:yes gene_type:complete